MKSLESCTCHTKALSRCHTDYSCHTDSPPCHTERSEVSTMESRFFAIAQNDKRETTQNDNAPTCHTEPLGEVSKTL